MGNETVSFASVQQFLPLSPRAVDRAGSSAIVDAHKDGPKAAAEAEDDDGDDEEE